MFKTTESSWKRLEKTLEGKKEREEISLGISSLICFVNIGVHVGGTRLAFCGCAFVVLFLLVSFNCFHLISCYMFCLVIRTNYLFSWLSFVWLKSTLFTQNQSWEWKSAIDSNILTVHSPANVHNLWIQQCMGCHIS